MVVLHWFLEGRFSVHLSIRAFPRAVKDSAGVDDFRVADLPVQTPLKSPYPCTSGGISCMGKSWHVAIQRSLQRKRLLGIRRREE